MKSSGGSKTILQKILLPIMLIVFVQFVLFLGLFLYSGVVKQVRENSISVLNQVVDNRAAFLNKEIYNNRVSLDAMAVHLDNEIAEILENNRTSIGSITTDEKITDQVEKAALPHLKHYLQTSNISGTYLVLGADQPDDPNKPGFYLRSLDMEDTGYGREIFAVIGQAEVLSKDGVPVNQTNSSGFLVDENSNYFYRPLQASMENPDVSTELLGFWSGPFQVAGEDVISYSIPIRDKNGDTYAIVGFDISISYLTSLLPRQELNSNDHGSYVLAVSDGKVYKELFHNGEEYRSLLSSDDIVLRDTPLQGNTYYIEDTQGINSSVYGTIAPLTIYPDDAYYISNQWNLIAIISEGHLLDLTNTITRTVLISLLISLFICLILLYIIGTQFTKPITLLVRKVKESDPNVPLHLESTDIKEIDELGEAIVEFSDNIHNSSSKVSEIITMGGLPIAIFEFNNKSERLFYTPNLADMLEIDQNEFDTIHDHDTGERILQKISELEQFIVETNGDESLYRLPITADDDKWLRFRSIVTEDNLLGIIADVTQEINEKKEIEYQKDYDQLTGLFNRNAFMTKLRKLYEEPEKIKNGAYLVLDMDNLKYLNDMYGHNYGDQFLLLAASVIRSSVHSKCIMTRISGDEFHLFLYDNDTMEKTKEIVAQMEKTIQGTTFQPPDHTTMRMRTSCGYAYYPEDAETTEELIRYADFAMHETKQLAKGQFNHFNAESYRKNSYLFENKEEFNQMIDNKEIYYVYHPIISASTGEVYSYEALMRSTNEIMKSPFEILEMAHSQRRLYDIEKITMFLAMETFIQLKPKPGVKVFVNSLPNQILNNQDFADFSEKYKDYLENLVVELTEEERPVESIVAKKLAVFRSWGSRIALDDYGTGYNGEQVLLTIRPSFVKIDMSIVTNIENDLDRQKIVVNTISYCKERGIKVIAEGVETKEQMKKLIELGVDLLQGFYFSKPCKELVDTPEDKKAEIRAFAANL